MPVIWKHQKNFDPVLLVRKIDETLSLSDNGEVQFSDFSHFEHDTVLYSMLQFPQEIPRMDAKGIVSQAMLHVAKNPPITPKKILAKVNRLTNDFLNQPEQSFILLTSVSLWPQANFPVTRSYGATVSFKPNPKQRFLQERNAIEKRVEHSLRAEIPTNYLYVRAFCRGKSIHSAANMALDAIDITRGILNWFENQRHFIRMSSGRPSPVNKIVLGPAHTLHNSNGSLASQAWWYEPYYRGPLPLFNPPNLSNMIQYFRDVRERLRRHPYRRFLENSIIRYVRALDESDWNNSFLRLWSLLEYLTTTEKGYDVTIKRTSFIFEEFSYHRQVLEHLRSYRNESVHEDNKSSAETYLYQLKNYVENLLRFHLFVGPRLGSIERTTQLLDLPPDKGTIDARIELLEFAKKFRN